ncbi:MAG: MOSC domain-containing protein [Nannocystales bacterium]
MRISRLFIYPIKSGPGIPVEVAVAQERGLANDRRFMVTSASGKFLSQRSHPALGRCAVRIDGDQLRLEAEGVGSCSVPLAPTQGSQVEVSVWSDTMTALRVCEQLDAFFTALVGEPAQLVYMPEQTRRPVGGVEGLAVSFADGYPILVANTASLLDLQERIEGSPIPMLAFRPNVVVEAEQAWAEDEWALLRSGETVLECTTGCERCSMTLLDPERPDRPRADGEPLRTLATFRRDASGKVIFGRNVVVREPGMLRVGDTLRGQ